MVTAAPAKAPSQPVSQIRDNSILSILYPPLTYNLYTGSATFEQ